MLVNRIKKKNMVLSATGILAVFLTLVWCMVLAEKNKNHEVSMFSWNYELEDKENFWENEKTLKEFNVTRVYQLMSADYIQGQKMQDYMENLSGADVEVVCLTGDKSWLYDGLEEFRGIVDALAEYNQQAEEPHKIRNIALDVEGHTLDEWQDEPKKIFRQYIQLMKEAREYANERDLAVIQVIPTFLDEVDSGLFEAFLLDCCDELSVMNYNKKNAATAARTEYDLCGKYHIPIESVFEMMPVDEEQGVTENITYYYEGHEGLKKAIKEIKSAYGPDMGIGLHHFTVIHEGNCVSEPKKAL